MTREKKGYAFEIEIIKDVENQSNRLNYGRHGKLKTNIK